MVSRNGVYYNMDLSPYRYTGKFTFVFSSKSHLDKFKKKLKENRDIVNYSLTKRFSINVDVSELADILLYKKVETRGFLVFEEGGEPLCLNNLKLGGEIQTIKN